MYRILEFPEQGMVIVDDDSLNAIRVSSLSDLLKLRKRINDYVDDQRADGQVEASDPLSAMADYMDTVTARKVASDRGYELPSSTIVSACARGSILGAVKDGGRWRVPRLAFDEWLRAWAAKE